MDNQIAQNLAQKGFSRVAGTDEAGRGPLAGDVFAAAVILPRHFDLPGLNDSKKLSAKKREVLFDLICAQAEAFAIARASVAEIETLNILQASLLAMRRAVEGLSLQPDYILVDGTICPPFSVPAEALPKGDMLSPHIAAASILAKVSRDCYMAEMDKIYPGYQFQKHKGYGTKAHYAAVDALGLCEIHRASFFKNRKRG